MIKVKHLFGELDQLLIELLKALKKEDWDLPTTAKLWSVKDVASHLLDTNLRTLSIQRDRYYGEKAPKFKNQKDLIDWLNWLNANWVNATKRLSPDVLISLLESSGKEVTRYYQNLPDLEAAIFTVAWAGEEQSLNWMHLAREYTEKWHHQQQIREAVGNEGIMENRFFEPLMDTFILGLPFNFKERVEKELTTIQVDITGYFKKSYFLVRKEKKWELDTDVSHSPHSQVRIPADIAWKLFCKNLRAEQVLTKIEIQGNPVLGRKVLEMVSVMA